MPQYKGEAVKLACLVGPKKALIVGYAQGRKGRIKAIVIMEGRLHAVGLRDVTLLGVPGELLETHFVKTAPAKAPPPPPTPTKALKLI